MVKSIVAIDGPRVRFTVDAGLSILISDDEQYVLLACARRRVCVPSRRRSARFHPSTSGGAN